MAADQDGLVVLDGTLAPVAASANLTGPGRLDPAHSAGLFTYRAASEVFVVFVDRGLLFASFTPRATDGGTLVYDYAYGAALAQ